MTETRTKKQFNFPDALRFMGSGHRLRRAGWDVSDLYLSLNAELGQVELVRECPDSEEGHCCYAVPWLGGAAIGGPPVEDLLAEDWEAADDSREPSRDEAEALVGELLDEAVGEEEQAQQAGASA